MKSKEFLQLGVPHAFRIWDGNYANVASPDACANHCTTWRSGIFTAVLHDAGGLCRSSSQGLRFIIQTEDVDEHGCQNRSPGSSGRR
jgi:hypothetical protein